ncbi:hypothetical protein RhiirA4_401712, partial [Rhizophagus irregularis]
MNFLIIILSLISFIVYKIYQKLRVPKGLENVPTISSTGFIIELLNKAGPDKRWEKVKDLVEKEGIGKV